ncbi:hypothetical protein ILYODFUR_034175 [Ilyodon furcidens]|uniref:Uncharacterized protein n=1 Tax=Ilyodon furcidens TaxID=33524 RepID=A0ABV0UP82_9TELE
MEAESRFNKFIEGQQSENGTPSGFPYGQLLIRLNKQHLWSYSRGAAPANPVGERKKHNAHEPTHNLRSMTNIASVNFLIPEKLKVKKKGILQINVKKTPS